MSRPMSVTQYKPLSYPFLKAYIITMRPYLMFVSGITGIAGMSFGEAAGAPQLLLIFLACFLSYGFGQALTDCFQTDTDSISSPYRPLTQNVVSRKAFLITSAAGLSFCIGILAVFNPVNLLLGAAAGGGLATYTYFKRRWWGGPFYNAWIVMFLFYMAFLSGSEFYTTRYLSAGAAAVLFGYANFVLSGYFKDIEADRLTGYNTLPVVYGRKISSAVSDALGILTIAAVTTILYFNEGFSDTKVILFYAAGVAFTLAGQVLLHTVKTDGEAFRAISPVVHAYILLLSSLALSRKPGWFLFLVIFYAAYLVVLKVRPSKEQI